jgi:hypothetical protein
MSTVSVCIILNRTEAQRHAECACDNTLTDRYSPDIEMLKKSFNDLRARYPVPETTWAAMKVACATADATWARAMIAEVERLNAYPENEPRQLPSTCR